LKSSIQLKTTKVFEHLDTSDKRIIVEQGGTRSGKTYNILIWIIFKYCMINTKKIITICRKHGPSLRGSSMRDFFDLLQTHNLYTETAHSKSLNEYRLNGNLIEFVSLDEPQKIRGRKRDLLFINEGNELTYEDFFQLNIRTTSRIIIDYNPSDEYHWLYDEIIERADCDFHITTYLDNPFLDPVLIEEIERLKSTDELYWQIYGLGERGSSASIIFTHSICDTIPEDAKFISFGLDYGYTNDPTALVGIWTTEHSLYIKEYLYQTMMTGRDIHKKFQEIGVQKEMIWGDSAEPRLNDELRRMGWNVRGSIKGRDSVNAGIDLLKRYKIHITSDSKNAIQEFRNYKWLEDKAGKLTNVPEDKNNHIIDAVRYGTYSIISRPTFGKYAIQ
jgi:phage terminase large subunit